MYKLQISQYERVAALFWELDEYYLSRVGPVELLPRVAGTATRDG